MANRPGFTLIELMVVIAVMAIVSAIALPNMMRWRHDREFTTGMQRTISVMNSARAYAVRENANAVILFDTEENGFRAFVDITRDQTWNPDVDRLIDVYDIPEGIRITRCTFPAVSQNPGQHRAGYQANGLPVSPGRVELTSRNGRSVAVFLARTGRIRTE